MIIQRHVQYIPRNMHTVFALLCFVVVIHWLIFPYPSGLLHWHCGNLTIAPVPAKQPWWIWINTSCEFIMNDRITRTKQSTTKPCAYFLGYTVGQVLAKLRYVNTLRLKQTGPRFAKKIVIFVRIFCVSVKMPSNLRFKVSIANPQSSKSFISHEKQPWLEPTLTNITDAILRENIYNTHTYTHIYKYIYIYINTHA